jgi:hypothetical protein
MSALTEQTTFALTSLKTLATSRGEAWTASITLNGKKVGTVEQRGVGGSNFYHFTKPEDREAFTAEAKRLYPEETFEVEDTFAVDLSMLAEFARKRSVTFYFATETDDIYGRQFRGFKSGVTFEQAREYLRTKEAAKKPYVFSKESGRFVAA